MTPEQRARAEFHTQGLEQGMAHHEAAQYADAWLSTFHGRCVVIRYAIADLRAAHGRWTVRGLRSMMPGRWCSTGASAAPYAASTGNPHRVAEVHICGVGSRCPRHDVELHGYPCWGCQQEWERRSPRVRAQIGRQASGKGAVVRPAQVTAARKADAAALATYDGPHEVAVERAGEHGPVRRLWNAVCTEGCGWSHFWLPSRSRAQAAADEHLADHGHG